jgi:anti-anti-sigma factor
MQEAPRKKTTIPQAMAGDQLKTATRQQDDLWIIDFVGDITKFADQEIDSAYRQIADQSLLFALNFSGCDYINSAGIAVIISLITQARRKGQRVLAYGLNPHYEKLFYMVGLTDYLETCASEADAVQKATALKQ